MKLNADLQVQWIHVPLRWNCSSGSSAWWGSPEAEPGVPLLQWVPLDNERGLGQVVLVLTREPQAIGRKVKGADIVLFQLSYPMGQWALWKEPAMVEMKSLFFPALCYAVLPLPLFRYLQYWQWLSHYQSLTCKENILVLLDYHPGSSLNLIMMKSVNPKAVVKIREGKRVCSCEPRTRRWCERGKEPFIWMVASID